MLCSDVDRRVMKSNNRKEPSPPTESHYHNRSDLRSLPPALLLYKVCHQKLYRSSWHLHEFLLESIASSLHLDLIQPAPPSQVFRCTRMVTPVARSPGGTAFNPVREGGGGAAGSGAGLAAAA